MQYQGAPLDHTRTESTHYPWSQHPDQQQYHGYPSQGQISPQYDPEPEQYHQYPQFHYQPQYQLYPTTPAFHGSHSQLPNAELADLGLAARDSRLDERWSSFMEDSGLLDGINFRTR
jgi:hypothetical protein